MPPRSAMATSSSAWSGDNAAGAGQGGDVAWLCTAVGASATNVTAATASEDCPSSMVTCSSQSRPLGGVMPSYQHSREGTGGCSSRPNCIWGGSPKSSTPETAGDADRSPGGQESPAGGVGGRPETAGRTIPVTLALPASLCRSTSARGQNRGGSCPTCTPDTHLLDGCSAVASGVGARCTRRQGLVQPVPEEVRHGELGRSSPGCEGAETAARLASRSLCRRTWPSVP